MLPSGSVSGNTPYWNGSSWVTSSSNLFNAGGNVGIGTIAPSQKLTVNGNMRVQEGDLILYNTGLFGSEDDGVISTPAGLTINLDNNNNQNELLRVRSGTGSELFSIGENGLSRANGEFLVDHRMVIGDIGPYSDRLYVYGHPDSAFNLINAQVNYSGFTDLIAVQGRSVTENGYGIGGRFYGGYRGVQGFGDGQAYTGTTYGVYGSASGSTGTRVGVYGTASGGTNNWAGYFSGNTIVTGNLQVGLNAASGYKVAVDGKVICEELVVQNSTAWPDYVFEPDYALRSLEDVSAFISAEGHLPGVPTAEEVAANGIATGAMQAVMMEKIEELTMYVIALERQLETMREINR